MSLRFPLLFIYGQSRFHTELKLRRADGLGEERRVMMLRVSEYNLIFRGGRLFQQYMLGFYVVLNKIGLISYERNRTIYEVTICHDYTTLFQEESEMALKLEEELYFQC
ncbi:hypothetical protein Tco_0082115, partial [Tanacetum coccineum]